MKPQHSTVHRALELQGGAVSRSQLRRLGLPDSLIDSMRDDGHLVSIFPGVYRGAGVPPSWLLDLVAATLLLSGRAVASMATAARLHSLPGYETDPNIEFSCQLPNRNIGGSVPVHSTRRLDAVDLVRVALPLADSSRRSRTAEEFGLVISVTTTTASRTIIDLEIGRAHV